MKKIAYFHIFGGPPIEASVHNMLATTFPEFDVESITLIPLLKKRPLVLIWNTLITLAEHGPSLLTGRKKFKKCFVSTTYLFKTVRNLARRKLTQNKDDYAFSFQLQSLFDTSMNGIPHYVYTDHTHLANLSYPGFDENLLHSPRWIALERQVYSNATKIFIRSSNISRSLESDYDCEPEKIKCVYVGSNAVARPAEPANENYTNGNILFVGTDWERKGGPVLLKAFERVLQNFPEAVLTIVGSTPETSVPNCRVIGRIKLEELSQYYSTASIFCLPTRHEPFGVVFIEAMSHGLPVVATSVGAVPDFVNSDTGIMVEPENEQALAGALCELLSNPDRARALGASGRELVAARYNWKRVGQAIRGHIESDLT